MGVKRKHQEQLEKLQLSALPSLSICQLIFYSMISFACSGETVVIKQVVGNCGGNQALTTMFAVSFLDKNGTVIKNDIKSRSKSRKLSSSGDYDNSLRDSSEFEGNMNMIKRR